MASLGVDDTSGPDREHRWVHPREIETSIRRVAGGEGARHRVEQPARERGAQPLRFGGRRRRRRLLLDCHARRRRGPRGGRRFGVVDGAQRSRRSIRDRAASTGNGPEARNTKDDREEEPHLTFVARTGPSVTACSRGTAGVVRLRARFVGPECKGAVSRTDPPCAGARLEARVRATRELRGTSQGHPRVFRR